MTAIGILMLVFGFFGGFFLALFASLAAMKRGLEKHANDGVFLEINGNLYSIHKYKGGNA